MTSFALLTLSIALAQAAEPAPASPTPTPAELQAGPTSQEGGPSPSAPPLPAPSPEDAATTPSASEPPTPRVAGGGTPSVAGAPRNARLIEPPRDPMPVVRRTVQVIGGLLAWIPGALLLGSIGAGLCQAGGRDGDTCGFMAIPWAYVGGGLGVGLGTSLIGYLFTGEAALLWTAGAGVLPALVGVALSAFGLYIAGPIGGLVSLFLPVFLYEWRLGLAFDAARPKVTVLPVLNANAPGIAIAGAF